MEATTSGRVSLGRLSNRRLNLATTGTDMSNIPNNYTHTSLKPPDGFSVVDRGQHLTSLQLHSRHRVNMAV